jgi:hypothetical protein
MVKLKLLLIKETVTLNAAGGGVDGGYCEEDGWVVFFK